MARPMQSSTRNHHPPASIPRGMRRPVAAAYIGVSESKFQQMVDDGLMPKSFKVGGVTLWDSRKIDQAFDELSNHEEESGWDDLHV
jgi:predicted DNA-binding transcriptional regulator AlpA